jgi:transcriptional regulator with XRE-family HTH domain
MAPHSVDVHVGRRLRSRRTMLGMSQENLGDAVGVTFQQIQKYERGLNRIGSSRLYEFSRILNVPVAYFFEEFDEGQTGQTPASENGSNYEYEKMANKEVLSVVRAFSSIENPLIRKKMIALIKSLSSEKSDSEKSDEE